MILCSEQDGNSSNEYIRKHKANDPRCTPLKLKCSICETSYREISLVSNADDSSWKYVSCDKCEAKLENETDLLHHMERVHEYGENCNLYPCEECGFQSGDIITLKNMEKKCIQRTYIIRE